MKQIVFYPTYYTKGSLPPPSRTKIGTLTATYHNGVGGFDLRPMVLELYASGTSNL